MTLIIVPTLARVMEILPIRVPSCMTKQSPGDSITVTINSENMSQLYNESKGRQVSLNTRINQIIKDHLNWHTNAPEAKMYYLPKSCITKVIDQLTELQISAMALRCSKRFQGYLSYAAR